MKRKEFIKSSIILGGGISLTGCISPQTTQSNLSSEWNSGEVAHIIPTVNHNRFLVSSSFQREVSHPKLKVGRNLVKGQMRDSQGCFWIFDCQNLEPLTSYSLQLFENDEALCDSWPLHTFPEPNKDIDHLKLMIYTCAGGHPLSQNFLPLPDHLKESPEHFTQKRTRLLQKGLQQQPDAIVVIGDTVYWDINGDGQNRLGTGKLQAAIDIAGTFDQSKPVIGTKNEEVLKKAVSPQIIDLYGTSCRSTPMFFFNDDHDYFENDEANESLVTFPPKPFQLELGRAVQQMYFPEFLPDENRPENLPGSQAKDRIEGSSESFGTLRYGRLAELLMFDCRRFVTLDGNSAQFIPKETEQWLHDRSKSQDVKHTVHLPSTPFGWSAGKWLEWYPDVLGEDNKLHAGLPKYLWQRGWQLQHNRLLQNMYSARHKKPIMISGDLHAFASGRIISNGKSNFDNNPINAILSGSLGCTVFPSTFRKIKASIPQGIRMEEDFENIEENGFSIVEFDSKRVHAKMYKYLWSRDLLEDIKHLEPFKTISI